MILRLLSTTWISDVGSGQLVEKEIKGGNPAVPGKSTMCAPVPVFSAFQERPSYRGSSDALLPFVHKMSYPSGVPLPQDMRKTYCRVELR